MRLAWCVALVWMLHPGPMAGQSVEGTAVLSADSVAIAEAFELRVEVPVPSGSMVYFPPVVPPTGDVESSSPVDWRARRGPDGGATIELTYELISFGFGTTALPPIEVITMPREDDVDGEGIPGGSVVGVWDERRQGGLYPLRIIPPSVWVEPVYTSEDIVGGMQPRGPDDVVGSSWSWPSMALVLLFSTVAGGAVVTTARTWLAERAVPTPVPPRPPTSLDEARRHALAELDRLVEAGPYPADRAHELYAKSSGVVRGYIERLDPAWGPELTSTELMERLSERSAGSAVPAAEMRTAEAVKFGRRRPGPESTAAYLGALRAWIAGTPETRS